jgi:hypothetical protein
MKEKIFYSIISVLIALILFYIIRYEITPGVIETLCRDLVRC